MGLSKTQQTIIDLLKLEPGESCAPVEFDLSRYPQIVDVALENEVASTIAFNLSRLHSGSAIPHAWQDEYQRQEVKVSAYLQELDRVASRLSDHQIPVVALKNAGIARGIYAHPGAVPMGDVDVLVDQRDFRKAHELMLVENYEFSFRSELHDNDLGAALQDGSAEYCKMLESGDLMWFELQWRSVSGRWIRPDQEPAAAELLARSLPIPGTMVRLLSPEDNLLQVCLHTAKHSYVRAPGLRLHLDVMRLVYGYPDLDWPTFMQRVQALQVKTAVYFSLLIPRNLFGIPVPDHVLCAMRPPAWKEQIISHLIAKAGLFNPHDQKFSRWEYILFNMVLYDDWRGLWRGIFPDRGWMEEQYGFQNRLLLPYYHARRIGNLLFSRLTT